tara:strand:- start:575 stop:742 length:168 start_codon:yes stop_codon:yes gene_type:complete
MKEIKPSHYVTKDECQKLIDKAIDRHNKTATIISAIIGSILLIFYAHGVITLVGK